MLVLRRKKLTLNEQVAAHSGEANRDGYVMVKVTPGKGKWRAEHSLNMEQRLGRPLVPPELVHHVDLNRSNNSDENLYLCKNMAEHNNVHRSLDMAVRKLVAVGILKFNEGIYEAVL